MLSKIVEFFQNELQPDEHTPLNQSQKHLACAALMIEVATIDDNFDERELNTMQSVLQTRFGISPLSCYELTSLARSESEDSTSIYQFTQLVNQQCSAADKYELILSMWEVAFADGSLDKYEEYTIRKVADLIHVSHSDFIRAKQDVKEKLSKEVLKD